jgi:heterodisulfide reductase subunit A
MSLCRIRFKGLFLTEVGMSVTSRNKKVMVVGGGISGLTAAWELAQWGNDVLVVEKGPFVGGHAAHLACKSTDRCLKCNDCLVEERLKSIFEKRPFDIKTRTQAIDIVKKGSVFHISLKSTPAVIDPDRCSNCGLCYQKCPDVEKGAVIMAPSHHIHPFYTIDPARCSCREQEEAPICRSLCPEKAITLEAKEELWSLQADGIVLASGYEPFDPEKIERFNFAHFENMITAMELEKMLRKEGRVNRLSDGAPPRNVAFVQCVGSRDSRLGHRFCSRVCCGYALRMGLHMVYSRADLEVTVFYMDIQSFGKDFSRYHEEARTKMRLLRGLPGDFYGSEDDRISLSYYDEESGKTATEDFDMVVLSVGIMPSDSNAFFEEALGCLRDSDGFLSPPDGARKEGIVLAGTVEGPMDISECITHAKRAAFEMRKFLAAA